MPNSVVVPAAATLDRVEAHIRPIPNNTLNLEECEEVAALATTVEGASLDNSPRPEGAVGVLVYAMTLNLKGEEVPPRPAWLPHPLLRPVSRMTLNLKGEEVPPRPARLPHPLLRPSHRPGRVPHAFPASLWEQRGRG